ncbi:hypothetical protein [Fusobacterium sp. IOR10]|uniref:hypothetical protein n=1 Tax=Fusobacterium sp. IOR10 TaxID=2665157 RepID=UPI0013D65DBF|nr:hypothetical protein [Fusobacterium sp. IOR10]
MNEIDIKILKFLVSGKAYSDDAILKNLGITKEELDAALLTLLDLGYIETYEDYLKRTNSDGKPACMSSSCGSNCSGCGMKVSPESYKNIKVITAKAIREFEF